LCGRKTLSHSCPLLVLGGATSEPDRQLGVPEVNDLSDPQLTSPIQTSVDIAVETTANSRETPDSVDGLSEDETRISTERTTIGDPSRKSIIEDAGGISFTEGVGSEDLNSSDSSEDSTNSAISADYSTTASALEAESADNNATTIAGEIESADHNNTASTEETKTSDCNTTVAVGETELSDSSTTAEADGIADQTTTAPGGAITIDYYTTSSAESEVADNSTDASAEHSVTVDHSTTASRGGHDAATNSTSADEPEDSDHSNTDYADVTDDADDSTTKAAEQTKTAHHNTTPSEDTGLFGALMYFKNKRQGPNVWDPNQTYLFTAQERMGSWAVGIVLPLKISQQHLRTQVCLVPSCAVKIKDRWPSVWDKHSCLLHRRGCGVCGFGQWVQSSRGKTPRCSYTTTTLL
jgi:hypothetical protein